MQGPVRQLFHPVPQANKIMGTASPDGTASRITAGAGRLQVQHTHLAAISSSDIPAPASFTA